MSKEYLQYLRESIQSRAREATPVVTKEMRELGKVENYNTDYAKNVFNYEAEASLENLPANMKTQQEMQEISQFMESWYNGDGNYLKESEEANEESVYLKGKGGKSGWERLQHAKDKADEDIVKSHYHFNNGQDNGNLYLPNTGNINDRHSKSLLKKANKLDELQDEYFRGGTATLDDVKNAQYNAMKKNAKQIRRSMENADSVPVYTAKDELRANRYPQDEDETLLGKLKNKFKR